VNFRFTDSIACPEIEPGQESTRAASTAVSGYIWNNLCSLVAPSHGVPCLQIRHLHSEVSRTVNTITPFLDTIIVHLTRHNNNGSSSMSQKFAV
jgi:hypothetical protein